MNAGPAAYPLQPQSYGDQSSRQPLPAQFHPGQPYFDQQQPPPPQQLPNDQAFYRQFQQQQQQAAYGNPPHPSHGPFQHVSVAQESLTAPVSQPIQTTASHSRPAGPTPFPQYTAPSPTPTTFQTSGTMAAPTPSFPPNNLLQQRQPMPHPTLAQQPQTQNTPLTQPQTAQQSPAPLSPESAAREKLRVSVLLEINTHLLQEVVSLQSQGKAGAPTSQPQQSPTSPTSATDPSNPLNNSPVDPSKPNVTKQASQEYADCMRRLQANLAYLAAIADSKKKATGQLPLGPAIMVPPPHLADVQDLYKKLNTLFPEASRSTVNKALAMANAQAAKNTAAIQAQG